MTPEEARNRMVAIEDHQQDWDAAQFIAWLLEFADVDAAAIAIDAESRRAFILAEGHYERVTQRVAVLHPIMIAQIGFLQGATFAAAAMGRAPYGEGDGDYRAP